MIPQPGVNATRESLATLAHAVPGGNSAEDVAVLLFDVDMYNERGTQVPRSPKLHTLSTFYGFPPVSTADGSILYFIVSVESSDSMRPSLSFT